VKDQPSNEKPSGKSKSTVSIEDLRGTLHTASTYGEAVEMVKNANVAILTEK